VTLIFLEIFEESILIRGKVLMFRNADEIDNKMVVLIIIFMN